MKLIIIFSLIAVAMSGKSKCVPTCPMILQPHCGILDNGRKVNFFNECNGKYESCVRAEKNLTPFKEIIKGECPKK